MKITPVSRRAVVEYIDYLTAPLKRTLRTEVVAAARQKALAYYTLFNENHRYLSYSILLFRKRTVEEQRVLF